MTTRIALLTVILHSSFGILHSQVPQLINYQGRVAVGTVNFTGSGQFKFALVNAAGTTTFWSNDGTSTAGSQPTAAVTLTVTKGLYSVLLGDTTLANMTTIPNAVFANADVRLRVWFNDGTNGSQLLTPDQRIAAVGYAIMAAGVNLPATTSATAGLITQDGSQLLHTYGNANLFAGTNAGNFALTGSVNTAFGGYSLAGNTTGSANTAMGREVLVNNATGNANTASGFGALYQNTAGSNNTAIGRYALFGSTGTGNLALGHNAGVNLATGDNNIYLDHSGAASESGIIRIGTPGTQTDTFLTGIIHGDGSGLTGVIATSTARNPQWTALLKWGVCQANNTFGVGNEPVAVCFDGASIWAAHSFETYVTKLKASDGAVIGSYNAGSATAAICFDGTSIWTANAVTDNVTKLNAGTGAIIGTYGVGDNPQGICFDGASIWVANTAGIASSNVTKLNASTGAVIGTYSVGTSPRGICFDGTSIWVANFAPGNVTKLNASTGAIIGTYGVGTNPVGICFDGASIWTANQGSDNVTKL